MIDLLDKIQGWVHNGPSGNDRQFLPLVMGALSMGAGIWAANKAAKSWEDLDIKQLVKDLAPSQGLIGTLGERGQELWGKAQDLWDPRSDYNQTQRNYYNENAQDILAATARNSSRVQGSTGVGFNPSQMVANNLNMQRNAQTELGNQWRSQLGQNQSLASNYFSMGGSLLNNQLQAQQQYDSILANAGIQNTATKNQFHQAIYGGAAQGLFSMVPGFGQGQSGWWDNPFSKG